MAIQEDTLPGWDRVSGYRRSISENNYFNDIGFPDDRMNLGESAANHRPRYPLFR
jgi:hypothetical protein